MLWSLYRLDNIDYDEMKGCIVRADSEKEARKLASKEAWDEGALVWLDPEKTECCEVSATGKPGALLVSIRHG